MNHEEATSKICPLFVISAAFDPESANGNCIGYRCMMWRRVCDEYGDDYGKDVDTNDGFCGLGGK